MASFARYSGTRNLPGVRRPQVIADTAVGRATQVLGGQIQQSARTVGQLAGKLPGQGDRGRVDRDPGRQRQAVEAAHRYQVDHFELKKGLIDLPRKIAAQQVDLAEQLGPGAFGYADKMMVRHDEEVNKLVAGQPEKLKTQARQMAMAQRGAYQARFEKEERKRRDLYYRQGIETATDALLETFRGVPEAFDEAFQQGRKLIVESGLVAKDKAVALHLWSQEAATAWAENLPPEEKDKYFNKVPHDAASLIKKLEDISSDAREGHGDRPGGFEFVAITGEDNTKRVVNERFVMTPAETARERSRKIEVSRQVVVDAVGPETWDVLPQPVRDGLTVVTYFAEELPESLEEAARLGDAEQVAVAIEKLKDNEDEVGAERMQGAADLARGNTSAPNVPPELKERIDAVPPDVRRELGQKATEERLFRASERRRAYSRQIEEGLLSVNREVIVEDPVLDDSQKVFLLKELDGALADFEKTRAAIRWLDTPGHAPPLDVSSRQMAGVAYKNGVANGKDAGEAAVDILVRKGVVPPPFAKRILADLRSTDPALVKRGHEEATRLHAVDPAALRRAERGFKLENAVLKWQVLRENMRLLPENAALQLARANDPDHAKRRETLLKSEAFRERIATFDADYLEQRFDPGVLSARPILGHDKVSRAAAIAEFHTLFRVAALELDGDLEAAEEAAFEGLSKTWGVSEYSRHGSDKIIQYPAEKLASAFQGKHSHIGRLVKAKLEREGIQATDIVLEPIPGMEGEPGTIERFLANVEPPFAVFYRPVGDKEFKLAKFPFTPTAAAADAAFKASVRAADEKRDKIIDGEYPGRSINDLMHLGSDRSPE